MNHVDVTGAHPAVLHRLSSEFDPGTAGAGGGGRTPSMAVGRVLGVDACPGGWVGIVLDRDRAIGRFAPTLAELVGPADDDLRVIAIDIPLGLPDTSVRQADLLVRGALGPRRSSLFMTPVRAAVVASTYDEANAINRRLVGQGVSRQSFGLHSRILEADEFVVNRPKGVIEVHPELSFATMAGTPLAHAKRTWVGARRRRELLRANGIVLDEVGPEVGPAGVDDVLDAAAAAWTARRRDRGRARAHPQPPQVFSDGISCAIWA